MADIEKVMDDLMDIKERNKLSECEIKTISDAIALLKEYKRKDGCPCTHCTEWECDEVCEEYKTWRDT